MTRLTDILLRRRPQVEYVYVYDRPIRPEQIRHARSGW
jgi:hypothetical protein